MILIINVQSVSTVLFFRFADEKKCHKGMKALPSSSPLILML